MKSAELLEKIGLEKREAQIYCGLLELGPSLISVISRHTGLHRPTIYKALPALLVKGLVSVATKDKQKLYVAETPEKLAPNFEALKAEVNSALAELQHLYQTRKKRPTIKVFTGKDGIAFGFNDLLRTLKRSEVYYRYTSFKAGQISERYMPKGWRGQREAKKLQRFAITDKLTEYQKKSDMNHAYKLAPPESGLFDYTINQIIYGDKIIITDFEAEMTIMIENTAIAEFNRKIFKLLYNRLE